MRQLCTKFVMLDIKYRFTCGDSDLSKIMKKCPNIMARIVVKVFAVLGLTRFNSVNFFVNSSVIFTWLILGLRSLKSG